MLLVYLVLNGVVQGSLLALICIGYSLAYGSARVINVAHADVMIAGGGYLVLLWIEATPPSPSGVAIMAVLFWAAGWIASPILLPQRRAERQQRPLLPALIG